MTDQLVTYELEDDIALIGLNRPDKRNAINDETNRQLRAALTQANEEAKAGVIFGHGDNFSAGLDLAEALEWINAPPQARRRRRGHWHPTLDLMARGGVPFVAALKGACIGGGLEVASAAHIRVADETTFFALPEGQRGIFVGGGGSVRIQRLMGYARMADLMLTGRVLTAEEGEKYNLCQYVTPKGESLERAKSLAKRIAKNAPLTNWAICACLPRVNDASHEDGLFMETLISQAVSSNRSEEGLKAFVEKRAARLVEPGKSGDQS
ncbi:crotonase/enoyl-CoA hydratase family protein [Methylocella sp. CPCC 101449]|uniref:crotonase/enoyl-CoA hydratase family protein n=1 Tax=Methylocella sp. CPCC 101449 TaxID=2987531 RepID=UPI00288DFBA3|nr:crotonase/enoyl-CoA hydratase family protein [Methylocella sp. CPCC 101449]MDT2021623.1 crotonase/enoyl-CoA hydratase family protein [Methylocella sp. CPCC 101449]